MPQLGFYINQAICIGCKACTVSCKDKNDLKVGMNFRRVYSYEEGNYDQTGAGITPHIAAYTFSIACNHCDNPACVKNCPTGAIEKRAEDGVVIIKQDVCIGSKYCISACPYGAPQFNEEIKKANKCNLCIDLLEKDENPVCVASCPMGAIEFGPIDELRKKYGKVAQIKGMPSAKTTNPNLVINPHRDAKL
ncbi:DMSO/selenate family reductase complex B subunit [Bacillus marasmi]|uniref:DMSO/selenate family reductase complex B subunit n=1 Tax=Bacillus marasmi TaxID=1926279 RepID=UPI0011CC3F82|nr:DMSO/selenate family reductase complex B subunit [Bacillus marasmi]